MEWKPISTAPKDGDEPILLQVGGDVRTASWHNGAWVTFDVADPRNVGFADPDRVRGWAPYPQTPEAAREMVAETAAYEQSPERVVERAEADLAAVRAELHAVKEAERAEAAAAKQAAVDDAADEREHEKEQERLRQWRQLWQNQ